MQKSRATRNIFVLILALAAVSVAAKWMAPREIIPWRSDFVAAVKESNATGRPVMLYFTASWCGPCQQMKGQTWSDATVKAALDRYIPVRIDVDQHPDLAQRFTTTSIPRLLVLGDDGEPMKIRSGFSTPDEIIEWLNR